MKVIKASMLRLLHIIILSFAFCAHALAQVSVTPLDGAELTDPNVTVCWPAQTGAIAYRLSFYELNWDDFRYEYVEKLIHTTQVDGETCLTHNFADLGSTEIKWKFVPIDSAEVVLPTAGGTTGELFSFKLINMGPNIINISPIQKPVGTPISFTVGFDESLNRPPLVGRSMTERRPSVKKIENLGLRKKVSACIKKRLNKLRLTAKTLAASAETSVAGVPSKAEKARAKSICRASIERRPKRISSRLGSVADPFGLKCFEEDQFNPGHNREIPCPAGMSISTSGTFFFISPEPARILVQILFFDGTDKDSQLFWATSVSSPMNFGGVAGLMTWLNYYSDMNENFVYPDYREVSSTAPGTDPFNAIDGYLEAPNVWMPNSGTWSYTVKVNYLPGQQMSLVENLWISFGERVGSAIPSPSDIVVDYTTKSNPSAADFIQLESTMVVGSFAPVAECPALSPECDGLISIGKQVTYVRIRGVNSAAPPPAIEEIGFFGFPGEPDCNPGDEPEDDLQWRTLAYQDLDGDHVPDIDWPFLTDVPDGICYGAATDLLGTGYIAPEDAIPYGTGTPEIILEKVGPNYKGNTTWRLYVSANEALFENKGAVMGANVDLQLSLNVSGSTFVSVLANRSQWPNLKRSFNPNTNATMITSGVEYSPNKAFVSLGSAFLQTPLPILVLGIETAGTGPTTISWGGQIINPGTPMEATEGIITQSGLLFEDFNGNLNSLATSPPYSSTCESRLNASRKKCNYGIEDNDATMVDRCIKQFSYAFDLCMGTTSKNRLCSEVAYFHDLSCSGDDAELCDFFTESIVTCLAE